MFNALDYRKKRILMLGGMVLLLYIAYVFSFERAISAVKTHNQLSAEQHTDMLDSTFPQIARKAEFYKKIIDKYKFNDADPEGKLWQQLSGIAVAKDVKIIYDPLPVTSLDTGISDIKIEEQQFIFKGTYFNLVKLLDSISKANTVGSISNVILETRKDDTSKESVLELSLRLKLTGLREQE